MNRYNSIIPRLIHWKREPWAITLGQTSYFTCSEAEVSERWHRHEDCHQMQWKRDGKVRFLVKYLWQGMTRGYLKIDAEIEARKAADTVL